MERRANKHGSASAGDARAKGPHDEASAATVNRFELAGERFVVVAIPGHHEIPGHLSAAERDITARIVDGASNLEIARERRTSVRTVANQVASIFRKLGVMSRSELVSTLLKVGRTDERCPRTK